MKKHQLLSFLLVAVLVGCGKSKPVVVLDSWSDVDYAKLWCSQAVQWHQENAAMIAQIGCATVTSCPEMMAIAEACAPDPFQDVRKFENDLATQFAGNVECGSVQFVRYEGPGKNSKAANDAVSNQYYSLSLDYRPGAKKQPWKMLSSSDSGSFTQGEGSPEEIAKQVCVIAKEQGAKLAN